MTNQRRHERYNLQLAVYLKDKSGTKEIKTGNISKYGMFLITRDIRPLRQLIQLVIEFPNKGDAINLLAQVMWADPEGSSDRSEGQPGMGVKFFSMPDQERQKWESFVDMVRTGRIRPETPAPAQSVQAEESSVHTIGEEELEELEDLDIDGIASSIEEEIIDIDIEEDQDLYSGDLSEAEEAYEREGLKLPDAEQEEDDIERREYPRKPVSFMVKLKDVDAMRQFFTRDISLGGMFLKTDDEKKTGEKVEVMVVHPWTAHEFPLDAVVRRVEKNETGSMAGLGVEFVNVDDDLRDSLLMFIESGYLVRKPDEDSPIESAVIKRIEEIEKQIKVNPIQSDLHFEVGLLYLGLSDWEKAFEHVDLAQKLGEDVPPEVVSRLERRLD